ncbi:MAG: AraC family transcriptional regulator [bacterium]|nr:AraC family transcriptional regulator [bacterium]MDD3805034.1 AraC family transcriptional regulator [bacterium]MDD4152436.1 AraC family transcriptional regulator [bacterium]MDD4558650.1 AraC family transcriptional regulator [bacterium]
MEDQWNDYYETGEPRYEKISLLKDIPYRILHNRFAGSPRVTPHWHEEIELLYVVKGRASQMINGYMFDIGPGDVVVIGSLDVHATTTASLPVSIMVLQFDLTAWGSISSGEPSIPDISGDTLSNPVTGPSGQKIGEYMKAVMREHASPKSARFALKGYIYLILHEMSQLYGTVSRGARYKNLHQRLFGLNRVLANINSDPCSAPSLPEAAAMTGMSASYFSIFFKNKLGKNYVEYIHDLRLRRVTRLLMETDLAIGDIAIQAGFSSLNFFNKVFRRHYGITPLQYRKNCRQSSHRL